MCADLNVSVWVARMLVSSTGQAVTTSPSLLLPSQPDTNTDYLASINQIDININNHYETCIVPVLGCGLWGEALVDGVLGDAGVGVLLGPGLALPPRH